MDNPETSNSGTTELTFDFLHLTFTSSFRLNSHNLHYPSGIFTTAGTSTMDPTFAPIASSSRRTIDLPDTSLNVQRQQPFDYHSLTDAEPVICIDNGETRPESLSISG